MNIEDKALAWIGGLVGVVIVVILTGLLNLGYLLGRLIWGT